MEKFKDNVISILVWATIAGLFAWPVVNIYLDVKMKWNLANIKTCPCIEQVKGE